MCLKIIQQPILHKTKGYKEVLYNGTMYFSFPDEIIQANLKRERERERQREVKNQDEYCFGSDFTAPKAKYNLAQNPTSYFFCTHK